jgi:Fe2+ transport system protein B
MGNSIGSAVSSNMEQMQRKLQEEMREKQWEMQLRGQERMMRTQLSMQMAMARERMYWMGGAYGAALTGVLGAKLKGHAIPKVTAVPLAVFTIFLAYQADFAWGNKAERINKMRREILENEKHWFAPLTVESTKDLPK